MFPALPDSLLQKVVPVVRVILVSINNDYADRHCIAVFLLLPQKKTLELLTTGNFKYCKGGKWLPK